MPGGQPTDVCGVDADYHDGPLYRIVFSLQPQIGVGLPFRFTRPIWEEEATLCHWHLYPPDYQTPPDPLPPGWTPPVYRLGVASAAGIPIRLIWTGQIVT